MRKKLVVIWVLAVLLILGYALKGDTNGKYNTSTLSQTISTEENITQTVGEKAPSITQVLVKLGSYESFCWSMKGTSLSVLSVPAESLKACINYSNGSALYWINTTDGRSFPYVVNSTSNDLDWSIITHTYSPELNIMNFLWWILENGNVTDVKRIGNHYAFHISLKYEEESNAGTIENPYLVRVIRMWNVTLIVTADGKPIGGHLVGRSHGPSNVVGANWFKEGNFTLLGEWRQ
ncbi:hypothetical protein [Thermococcus sp. 21S9]|uniref:hypothetical protein n=1 Tax=Thermococcus sp. 21S9 TaxID=1638223 RepID=UPI00143941F1|nr:hypothetical protein [Thermococcus sp. 21S9]NJE54952.1 hypothetical protein [Thermococcus sp. 21S9]